MTQSGEWRWWLTRFWWFWGRGVIFEVSCPAGRSVCVVGGFGRRVVMAGWAMRQLAFKRLDVAAASVGCVAVVALVLLNVQQSSNCGGNSAALHEVRRYWMIVDSAAAANPHGEFDVTRASAEERSQLAELAEESWIDPARYLVSTLPCTPKAESRRLLVVCDQAFRNVPRRMIWQAPPTHAAAYSDGTVELMSEADFARLDLSSWVSLERLVAERTHDGARR